MSRILLLFFFCLTPFLCLAEEAFLLMNADSLQIIAQQGSESSIQARVTPCSTFKIALSLMGFDSGILKDATHPEWPYLAYANSSSACNKAQVPKTWIANSCIWYSQQITKQLGNEKLQAYLQQFQYGNRDISGNKGTTPPWVNSSLKISMLEQVAFLKRLLKKELLVSDHATETTVSLLYMETLKNGWNLYGKTGFSGVDPVSKEVIGWLIGWIEKDNKQYVFAYKNEGTDVHPETRLSRTEILLKESGVMD